MGTTGSVMCITPSVRPSFSLVFYFYMFVLHFFVLFFFIFSFSLVLSFLEFEIKRVLLETVVPHVSLAPSLMQCCFRSLLENRIYANQLALRPITSNRAPPRLPVVIDC